MSQNTAAHDAGPHDAWLRRLSAYHSDAPDSAHSPVERIAIEAHLRTCGECQRALAAYQRLYALASSPLRLGAPNPALARQDRYFVAATARSTQRRVTHMPPSSPFDDPSDRPTEPFTDATTRPMRSYPASRVGVPSDSSPSSYPPYSSYPSAPTPSGAPGGRTRGRRPRWRGVAAALVAALLIVAFAATLIPRILANTGHGTPTATIPAGTPINKHIPTSTVIAPTLGPTPTIPPAPTGFVCADAPGSNGVYAFINTDLQLYSVTGCGAPRQLTNIPPLTSPNGGPTITAIFPLAFSPANTRLMLNITTSETTGATCQQVLNLSSDTLAQTPFCNPSYTANWTQWTEFIGWQDDNTFLESITMTDAHVRVVRVDATSFAQTTIATLPVVLSLALAGSQSGIALRKGALFYAGYADGSTTQAALRRYSLTDGSDRQIVPLGIAGYGGCQMSTSPCGWTGPWDISPDGTHIMYHNPGPQISLSDTTNPPDTPLFYANSDGSGGAQVFSALPQQPNTYITPTSPVISPDGSYAVAAVPNSAAPARFITLATPSHATSLPANAVFDSWRTGSAAMLVTLYATYPQTNEYAIYTLATGQLTVLTANTSNYVWGN